VAWLVATTWFIATYSSPCQNLPSKEQLSYYENSGEDQDIYAGVSGFDSRGLKFFPQLWYAYPPGSLMLEALCVMLCCLPCTRAGAAASCSAVSLPSAQGVAVFASNTADGFLDSIAAAFMHVA